MTGNGLTPLSDDEAALLYTVGMCGSAAYPIAKVGKRWFWEDRRTVSGPPIVYKTKRAAVTAFEGWKDLAHERWRAFKQENPTAILTAVGVKVLP